MASVRMIPNNLRFGLGYVFGGSLIMALFLANWEPTFGTSVTVERFVAMGAIFVPMLAAFSLTLLVASFAFVEVSDDSAESSLKKPEKPYFS